MSDFTFRVKPEELEKKSAQFSKLIQSIQKHFDKIASLSGKTRGFWIGEAGDKDRVGYASYEDDVAFIIKRLEEHPIDLLKMAGIYKQAEQTVTTKNVSLKVDQIV